MLLHNAGRYKDLTKVNEQILQINWKNDGDNNLFHENAKRDIADTYADMGNIEKAYELYREYLEKDPLWGWGWIGYYRQLNDHDEPEFIEVIDELYRKIKKKDTERMAKFSKSKGLTDGKLSDYTTRKIYPNEPCPCGSGKKYRRWLGKD